jgi:hypothetical protein
MNAWFPHYASPRLDKDDADAIRILQNCRRAMKPDARLVAIEAFFAGPGEQIPANMIDIQVPLFVDAIRTGESQTVPALGASIWDYYTQRPEEGTVFTEATNGYTSGIAHHG